MIWNTMDRCLNTGARDEPPIETKYFGGDVPQHRFTKSANVFNTLAAASTFRDKHATDNVVVRIGRKFCVVKPDVAKRLKLNVIDPSKRRHAALR